MPYEMCASKLPMPCQWTKMHKEAFRPQTCSNIQINDLSLRETDDDDVDTDIDGCLLVKRTQYQ